MRLCGFISVSRWAEEYSETSFTYFNGMVIHE